MNGRFSEHEFTTLRQAIAARGTARMLLAPVTFVGWGLVNATLLLFGPPPAVVVLPLLVLAAGFEAIHALHGGAERIGRYLQVFYEADPQGPRWETAAMSVGPALPGGGIDPLFSVLFISGTAVNLLPLVLSPPPPVQLASLVAVHAAFVFRIVRARVAAARQRAVELESFKAVKSGLRNHAGGITG